MIALASGEPLTFEQIPGAVAREAGFATADLEGEYIKVALARPVPAGGGARIRIIKTYKDPKSYFRDGDTIVFDRPLGSTQRHRVAGRLGVTTSSVPATVTLTDDGRVRLAYVNPRPDDIDVFVKARR